MMNKILSKLLFAVLAVLFTAEVMAQVPQGFNFQAVARNADGDLIVNAELGVQISVLQGSEEGNAVYTETQNPTTNAAGSFQIVIGEGTSEDDFSGINWGSDNFYVKLAIDPAGGTEYEDLGTTRLLSVPYALLAKDVVNGSSGSGEITDYIEINTEDPLLQDSLTIVRSGGVTEEGEIAYGLKVFGESTGFNIPVFSEVREAPENNNGQYAVAGWADGPGTGNHIGVIGTSDNPEATGGSRTGVYGQATSKAKYNYGVSGYSYGVGNGDEGEGFGEGSINFGLRGFATNNTWGNIGLEAQASGNAGKNNFGVHGLSSAGTETTAKNYGVAGRASGPGINYGVYGAAWDGVENYAGFFDGDVNINGLLTVNGEPIAGSGSVGIDTLNSVQRLQLNNAEENRAALFLTTPQGLGNLYFYNANQQNTGWFGNSNKGGFMQLVGYEEDGSFTGATLTGMASWNNNLPYFFMEGTSEDPYVQLVSFGGTLNSAGEEVPYFDLQTTQRGIDGKAPAFSIGVVNNTEGNDPDGESTEMFIRGESTPNFQISGKSWENNNLPFFAMYGSTSDGGDWYHNNLELSVGADVSNEWGVMSIKKTSISSQTSSETILLDGNNGNINISGTLSQSSDKRLKKDIKTLDNALEKTQKLRGVSYIWKTDKTAENPQIGVIAQEVEEIYPEFVQTDENGMKSVNYAQMTAVLIEAVKALNEKVEGLQTDNATLQAKVDQQDKLESRIANIEKLLHLQNATQVSEQTNTRK